MSLSLTKRLKIGTIIRVEADDHTTMSRWTDRDKAFGDVPNTIEFIGRFLNADGRTLRLHSMSAGEQTSGTLNIMSVGEIAYIPIAAVTCVEELHGNPKRPRRKARKSRSRVTKG